LNHNKNINNLFINVKSIYAGKTGQAIFDYGIIDFPYLDLLFKLSVLF